MKYTFCNLEYQIPDIPVLKNPVYDPFRSREREEVPFVHQVRVELVQQLDIPKEEPIFANIQGLRVVQKGTTEYRYYCNFFTGEIRDLLIDNGTEKVLQVLEKEDGSMMTELDLINCLAFEKTMWEAGRFILHSSFIETDKGAILFTAPSGTGKSTQAELWRKYRGVDVINGDRAGIWKEDGIWMAGGVLWCGTSEIMKNKTMPLRAIVVLKQGPENEILKMRFPTKVGQIIEQITVNPWNKQMIADAQMFCMLLCQEIPVIYLSCRPDEGAVEVLEKELERLE